MGSRTAKGYLRHQFGDAWERYLGPEGYPNRNSVTNVDKPGTSDTFQSVTPEDNVTVRKCEKSNNDGLCYAVTVQEGENGQNAQGGEIWALVCEHCGDPEKPDAPVLLFGLRGRQYLMHLRCKEQWLADPDPDDWSFNLEDQP